MTGTERPAALQDGTIRLLFDVEVRFHRNRFPAADWVDGDLLILGTAEQKRRAHPGATGSGG